MYCLQARSYGFKICVLTILPHYNNPYWKITQINDSIRANWATFADGLADIGSSSLIGDSADCYDTYYYHDSVHTNYNGCRVIATYVQEAIKNF